jgi:hypothetical protein
MAATRKIENLLIDIRGGTRDLGVRLEAAQRDAFDTGELYYSSATEVDRLHHLLDQSSNYIADKAERPQVVQFDCGRTVRIVTDADGPYLDVSFVPANEIEQPPLTETEQAALDMMPPDFIERLIDGRIISGAKFPRDIVP